MTREEFEDLVGEALDTVPEGLMRLADNVVVLVEDNPPPGRHIRGLYRGVPRTKRGHNYVGMLPDTIHIYRNPIMRMSSSQDDIIEQVRIVVVHEIAHLTAGSPGHDGLFRAELVGLARRHIGIEYAALLHSLFRGVGLDIPQWQA